MIPGTSFNVSEYLLDRHVHAGHGGRLALTGVAGDVTYAGLLDRVGRAAQGLRALGLQADQRVVMIMADSPEFVVVYLAAMRIGAVPVPISTMLRAADIAEILTDSRARIVTVSGAYREVVASALAFPGVREVAAVVTDDAAEPLAGLPTTALSQLAADTPDEIYPTTADSPAFWLYTSGTTGTPKGAMHRHGSVPAVCETYGAQVLGITPQDRCLSAAKAFFAYGLGNSVLFPLSVGATAILEPSASRPEVIAERARAFRATLFFAGPTFFSNMLRAALPPDALAGVRLAASAGETLPAILYQRWTSHFGVDILDGIGMTEMLHIFLSNRPGRVRPGTTGVAVPGYELRVLGEDGQQVPPGTPGTLFVRGESAATGYWSRYDASRQVFQGEWLRTGDTYVVDADGYYACLGRTGDMLKASGIWVSPAEVESRLLAHADVAQAIVVAANDTDGLEKPVAFVQLNSGALADEETLIAFCRLGLPSFKRPRRIVFVTEFPTTATGKIRRVELRAEAAAILQAVAAAASAGPAPGDKVQ
ncbi:MAG: benzoate-CoA ligase family protein [Actinomycetota bacterium]|nr:benzoate-CoA ligase family protein [Actinomycetota bacterium]